MGKHKEIPALSQSYHNKHGNNSGVQMLVILGLQRFTLVIK